MNSRTAYVFLVLLFASWMVEAVLGQKILDIFWGTAWFSWGAPGQKALADVIAGFGRYSTYTSAGTYRTVDQHWTPGGVLTFFFVVYVVFHVVWAVAHGLLWPFFERWHLGARWPSFREVHQFETAYAALARNSYEVVAKPGKWKVADGLGLQVRWIGYVLIIDRELLSHRHFMPLLAHELGHTNSEDRLAHRLFAIFPPTTAIIFALAGFPFACGLVLLYPLWMWYWKKRVYAADVYAVRLGQGYALVRALDELYLRLDSMTQGGRMLRPVPYVEQRIGRIQELLTQVMPPGGAARII
jgi:hypothetical protein